MTPPAPKPDTTCRVCVGPLISVRDDPHDPQGRTHPGCAPVYPQHFERHEAEQRREQQRRTAPPRRGQEARQR